MSNNLILITGGTGKTGSQLVSQLRAQSLPIRIASRNPTSESVSFDWNRSDTWAEALCGVRAAYLVSPPMEGDISASMIRFVQQAIAAGVQRFVLLSASLLPEGGPAMGRVHLWLRENAAEWIVLRPSWFMQNFSEGPHALSIRNENTIYSATGTGRTAFVSTEDIAASAFEALTARQAPNTDYVLTGPAAITYDEVAHLISRSIGRIIKHKGLSVDGLAERYRLRGMPTDAAQTLASMDHAIETGMENRTTTCVRELTGKDPVSFYSFVSDSLSAWPNSSV